jgi:hypothetical protein
VVKMGFFLQLRCNTAIGARDQEFSATIPPDHRMPLCTMLAHPGPLIRPYSYLMVV